MIEKRGFGGSIRLWAEGECGIFRQCGELSGGSASLPASASRKGATGQTHRRGTPVFNGKMPPKVWAEPGRALPGHSGVASSSEGPRRAGQYF